MASRWGRVRAAQAVYATIKKQRTTPLRRIVGNLDPRSAVISTDVAPARDGAFFSAELVRGQGRAFARE